MLCSQAQYSLVFLFLIASLILFYCVFKIVFWKFIFCYFILFITSSLHHKFYSLHSSLYRYLNILWFYPSLSLSSSRRFKSVQQKTLQYYNKECNEKHCIEDRRHCLELVTLSVRTEKIKNLLLFKKYIYIFQKHLYTFSLTIIKTIGRYKLYYYNILIYKI